MDENSPEMKFNRMMEQEQARKNKQMPQMPQQAGGNKQSTATLDEQRILNQVRANVPMNPISSAQGTCPDCGTLHPPVEAGRKCPNAKTTIDKAEGFNVNEFVVKVRDILASQVEQKNVKDFKKVI